MLVYWVWFAQLSGISLAQKLTLLQHFHDPEEIYHLLPDALAQCPEQVQSALAEKDLSQAQEILSLCIQKGIGIITLRDDSYPTKLRNTYDPPLILYFKGKLPDWEAVPVIGVVGTRKASAYGLTTAQRFGSEIAGCGALVVSGGAGGIDTRAMEGALEGDYPVVGVLGCGVDVVYPAGNKQLFERVCRQGCLISEYPPKTTAAPWHFPHRNRIISGMSDGLLVVEAPEQSGALITARHALEQGRDVFVVPGNIDVASCAGSNALLQERATAALSGWNVVQTYEDRYPGKVHKNRISPVVKVAQTLEIPSQMTVAHSVADKKAIDKEEKSTYTSLGGMDPSLSEEEQTVLDNVPAEPMFIDELIAASTLPAGKVKSILTKLALKKKILQHPGGRVSRK